MAPCALASSFFQPCASQMWVKIDLEHLAPQILRGSSVPSRSPPGPLGDGGVVDQGMQLALCPIIKRERISSTARACRRIGRSN